MPLARGEASDRWDPSLTRLGELAAERTARALFISGNWGVAVPMYCLSHGNPELYKEPWRVYEYGGPAALRREIEAALGSGLFRTVYLVRKDPPYAPDLAGMRETAAAVERHPDLREVPVEEEFARLAGVKVRKFVYSGSVLGTEKIVR